MTTAQTPPAITITSPIQGSVLHARLGQPVPGGLQIQLSGEVTPGCQVTVQGQPAAVVEGRFSAPVVLNAAETEVVAVAHGPTGSHQTSIRLLWDRHSRPRYRFAIDDNSFFLRDIWRQQYPSLFDCFYLRMLRDLHEKYRTRFVLNIYYTTGDEFDLSRFPDRYQSEWRDNAHWLRLAFHAHADKPDRPYQDASPQQLLADFDRVVEQIHRFAPDAYSPTTVIHWGMVRPEAYKPLYDRGVRVLSGYFQPRKQGWNTMEGDPSAESGSGWDVNYGLDAQRSAWLWRHDALKDFDSGLLFSRMDLVCNIVPLDQIVPTLQEVLADPQRAEIVDILTHEQYFWPFYDRYLPDHAQRLDAALGFLTEHGYEPVFLHEGFLGGPEPG